MTNDADRSGLTPEEQGALERIEQIDTVRFEAFAREFHTESDRAAVVLGAAKLDELLKELLERFLLPKADADDELLGGDDGGERPLSAFSGRINAAHRLGLVSAEFRRSLHLVRKIRNKFAHRVSSTALNESPYREFISELTKPIPSPTFWNAVMQQEYGDERGSRVEFRVIVAVYAYILESALVLVKRVPQQPFLVTMVSGPPRGPTSSARRKR